MNKSSDCDTVMREVADPANRKTKTWQISFAGGAVGHIVKKHVAKGGEPWESAIDKHLLSSMKSLRPTDADRQTFKSQLLDHAQAACRRPQAMTYDERQQRQASESVRCCLLVCRCGLLIVLRNVDTQPKIHTAFFRRGVAYANAPEPWKKLTRDLRNDYVVTDRQSGKLTYPAPDDFKEAEDLENPQRSSWRVQIDFHSKHTWGFKEQAQTWFPIGEFPPWQEPKK